MASSLMVLLDDIAYVLDDIATLTKIATKKTAGVLGDDLALNAKQVAGVRAARELPIVWAVAKGSFKNKLIIVPVALLLSAFAPFLIAPLLMIGGAYLCYEGFEKIIHRVLHPPGREDHEDEERREELEEALLKPEVDLVALEKEKIQGAIRTDFILSTEIIVITLGTVAVASFASQVAVLAGIGIIMTVGVYGLVAGIVKLDDGGFLLTLSKGQHVFARMRRRLGRLILSAAPYLMKGLSIVGTAAMFTVGGGIIVHGVHALEEIRHRAAEAASHVPGAGATLEAPASLMVDITIGLIVGAISLGMVALAGLLLRKIRSAK